MASCSNLCFRMLPLFRLTSHIQACCSSSGILTTSATCTVDQIRTKVGFTKAGGDTAKQKKKSGPRDAATESNPRLQALVELLSLPDRQQIPNTKKEQDALVAHEHLVAAQACAWSYDMAAKLYLQQAALRALPPRLRELAAQPDHTPFPMNRGCLFDTPPEAYRDPAPGASSGTKAEKGRTARG